MASSCEQPPGRLSHLWYDQEGFHIRAFWVFFPFYPPPSPLFSPFAKKIKALLQKAPALPFPVQTGPGQARESAGQTPSRGQVAREGVGEGWDSSSWSFSPEEEENEQLRLPGEAAAAAPSARSRTWSTVAARGGGKPPQKSGFWEAITFPGAKIPEAAGAEYSLCFSLHFLLFFCGESISDPEICSASNVPPRLAKRVGFFALYHSATESPRSALKTPGNGALNTAQSTRGKTTFKPFATGSVSTWK